MTDPEYLRRMLVFAARYDIRSEIDWTLSLLGDEVTFLAEVGNLFTEERWETVPVGPADMDAFEAAVREVGRATDGDHTYGPSLYACRVRRKRPCNMGFPSDARLHRLFLDIEEAPDEPEPPAEPGRRRPQDSMPPLTPIPPIPYGEEGTTTISAGDGWPELRISPVAPEVNAGIAGARVDIVDRPESELRVESGSVTVDTPAPSVPDNADLDAAGKHTAAVNALGHRGPGQIIASEDD